MLRKLLYPLYALYAVLCVLFVFVGAALLKVGFALMGDGYVVVYAENDQHVKDKVF